MAFLFDMSTLGPGSSSTFGGEKKKKKSLYPR
jgi:hypothetical protein